MHTDRLTTHFDVIIVGCGPVGAVSANILGQYGIKTLIIEREINEHGQPRAFSCDDEAMRIYQSIGLDEQLRAGVGGKKFAKIILEEVDLGHGFRPIYFFHQKALEATLRSGFRRYPSVTLIQGQEVINLRQTTDGVYLDVRDVNTDDVYAYTADYVLGADGGRSTIRKLLDITLHGIHYEEPWLAVSGTVTSESAKKVDHIRFVCNPERPTFVGPAPFHQYRMEFMLNDGETTEAMEDPAKVRELISPYVDPDQFQIERAAVYTTPSPHSGRAGACFYWATRLT
jgi:3-(3-hydroxy-phenyl)propionate hydroxylase